MMNVVLKIPSVLTTVLLRHVCNGKRTESHKLKLLGQKGTIYIV